MNSITNLVTIADNLQAAGVTPKLTKLPSQVKTRRTNKSVWGVKKSASRRRSGATQMQDCNKIYHTSGHR